MFVIYGIVALCSLAEISAADLDRDCRDLKSLKNFNQSKYLGSWYENGWVNNWVPLLICTKATWFPAPTGEIHIEMIQFSADKELKTNASMKTRVPDAYKPGEFEITFVSGRKKNTWILGTDYTSYSVEYDCREKGGLVKIVTREVNPPQSVINEGMRVIREHGVTIEKYKKIDQSCWKSEVPSNEEKTTTKAPKTEKSPENPEFKDQPPIVENKEQKVVEHNKPEKPLSLNFNIEITV